MVKLNNRSVLIVVILALATTIAGAFHFYRDSFVEKRQLTLNTQSTMGLVFFDRLRTNTDNYLLMNVMGHNPPTCNILDYEGNTVYNFPKGHCEFSSAGDFYHISSELRKFDAEGQQVWKTKNYHQHHSTYFSNETQELFLTGREEVSDELSVDTVVGISSEGKETFFWRADENFKDIAKFIGHRLENPYPFPGSAFKLTHFNAVQVIPPNELEKSIPAFKRGNILVSCFLQSILFIIDRDTRKIVWHKVLHVLPSHGAHSPKMLSSGHIFMYLNRRAPDALLADEYSSVAEYDPVTDKFSWEYFGEPKTSFFSEIWSAAHVVGEDQFLATVAEKGTVAQLNRQGRILWEWHSRFEVTDIHPTYQISPVYEVIPIKKSLVGPHIKQWKLMGNPMEPD